MSKDTSHVKCGQDCFTCDNCGQQAALSAESVAEWIKAGRAFEKDHAACRPRPDPPGFSAKEWEARYISERGTWTRETSALRERVAELEAALAESHSALEYAHRSMTLVGDLVAKAPEHHKYRPEVTFTLKKG